MRSGAKLTLGSTSENLSQTFLPAKDFFVDAASSVVSSNHWGNRTPKFIEVSLPKKVWRKLTTKTEVLSTFGG